MNEIIALEGIQTRYGDVIVLDDINLSIARGRPLALRQNHASVDARRPSAPNGWASVDPTGHPSLLPARGAWRLPVDDRLRASGLLRTALRRT